MRGKPTLAWLFAAYICVVSAAEKPKIELLRGYLRSPEGYPYALLTSHHSSRLYEISRATSDEEAVQSIKLPSAAALELAQLLRRTDKDQATAFNLHPGTKPFRGFVYEASRVFGPMWQREEFADNVQNKVHYLDQHALYLEHALQGHFTFNSRPKPNNEHPLYVIDTVKESQWRPRDTEFSHLPQFLRFTTLMFVSDVVSALPSQASGYQEPFMTAYLSYFPEIAHIKDSIVRASIPSFLTGHIRSVISMFRPHHNRHLRVGLKAGEVIMANLPVLIFLDLSLKLLQYLKQAYPRLAQATELPFFVQRIERQKTSFLAILSQYANDHDREQAIRAVADLAWVNEVGGRLLEKRFQMEDACLASNINPNIVYAVTDHICPFVPATDDLVNRAKRTYKWAPYATNDGHIDTLLDEQLALEVGVVRRDPSDFSPTYTYYPVTSSQIPKIKKLIIREHIREQRELEKIRRKHAKLAEQHCPHAEMNGHRPDEEVQQEQEEDRGHATRPSMARRSGLAAVIGVA